MARERVGFAQARRQEGHRVEEGAGLNGRLDGPHVTRKHRICRRRRPAR